MAIDYIDQTKKALEAYNSGLSELETLYKKALDNQQQKYSEAKESLEKQYQLDRNTASTKTLLDEKNRQQFIASRGLAFSGESEQSKLNATLAENNLLGELANTNAASLAALEGQNLQATLGLDKDFTDKKQAGQQWLTNFYADQAKQAATLAAAKASSSKEPSKPKEETAFTPPMTPKDHAKNILTAYTEKGKITSDAERNAIQSYLQTLTTGEKPLDAAYMKDLLFLLGTYGYKPLSDESHQAQSAYNEAKDFYERKYKELYQFYLGSGRTQAGAAKVAREYARTEMLDYLYMRSRTVADFRAAAALAGVKDAELNNYFTRVEEVKKSGKGNLGLGVRIQ